MTVTDLTLTAAQTIVAAALSYAETHSLKPLAVVVLDARGADKALAAQDGASLKRVDVARGKASGALALGMGSRSIFKRAKEQPFFIAAVCHSLGDTGLVPVPGGALIEDDAGRIVGAVGVSGDTSDNDEAAAMDAIAAAGLKANPGSDQ
jgi:uncharacterized protein GlcG (DUF336 family)